jgi:hypothetical protein
MTVDEKRRKKYSSLWMGDVSGLKMSGTGNWKYY